MDSIGALASGIAHDLNNVLAPILMAADLLRDRQTSDESVRMLDIARNSARRGADLVGQILQFARGSTSDESTDLRILIEEIAKFVGKTFPRPFESPRHAKVHCKSQSTRRRLIKFS